MPDEDRRPDGDAAIDERWPYDGPHSGNDTIQAALAIEHLVCYLNNATDPGH
jgi:hypothetical protein